MFQRKVLCCDVDDNGDDDEWCVVEHVDGFIDFNRRMVGSVQIHTSDLLFHILVSFRHHPVGRMEYGIDVNVDADVDDDELAELDDNDDFLMSSFASSLFTSNVFNFLFFLHGEE